MWLCLVENRVDKSIYSPCRVVNSYNWHYYLTVFWKCTATWRNWHKLCKSMRLSSAVLLAEQTSCCRDILQRKNRWLRRRDVRAVRERLSKTLVYALRETLGPRWLIAPSKAMSNRLRDRYWCITESLRCNIVLYYKKRWGEFISFIPDWFQ